MQKFNIYDIHARRDEHHWYYWFECSMCSVVPEVFGNCDSNYEVEDMLRKHKVIRQANKTDTESCALVVNFSSRRTAENFIKRLNIFLGAKANAK